MVSAKEPLPLAVACGRPDVGYVRTRANEIKINMPENGNALKTDVHPQEL